MPLGWIFAGINFDTGRRYFRWGKVKEGGGVSATVPPEEPPLDLGDGNEPWSGRAPPLGPAKTSADHFIRAVDKEKEG